MVVALLAAVAVPAALGAGYGRGKFVGKASSQFDSDRPRTPIELKVKGNRIRVIKAVFIFDCADDGSSVRRTVSTPFTKVKPGPAGGGAFFDGSVKAAEGGQLDVTFYFGLRQKAVLGNSDAVYEMPDGLNCLDDADFKANRK